MVLKLKYGLKLEYEVSLKCGINMKCGLLAGIFEFRISLCHGSSHENQQQGSVPPSLKPA